MLGIHFLILWASKEEIQRNISPTSPKKRRVSPYHHSSHREQTV